jgi:hypothetical protein
MGARRVDNYRVLRCPRLVFAAAACVLACGGLLAVPAAAQAAHVNVTIGPWQGIDGYNFTAGSTVTVDVFATPGGAQVWHHVAPTDSGGNFNIGQNTP